MCLMNVFRGWESNISRDRRVHFRSFREVYGVGTVYLNLINFFIDGPLSIALEHWIDDTTHGIK